MIRGWISLGSNIEREQNIRSALSALTTQLGDLICSGVYESDAIGFEGSNFYNMVVGFDSTEDVFTIAGILKKIETEQGRTRNAQKFSSRTLDLDLILYGDLLLNEARLKLPREDILKYAFVLQPLAEVAPTLRHPVNHKNYAELWAAFDKSTLMQQLIDFPH